MIPYSRQCISEDDIQAVVDCLKSDYITQGPSVHKFEDEICECTGARYSVAVNSGTSGLHVACLSLGLKKGDRLWTSPITFVASANCGAHCGAQVDFVDIDPFSWNISVEKLREKLEWANVNNKLPTIVVVVHFSGLSCDMEEIHKLSKQYSFYVIEDACHALGGRYKGNTIGSCKYSDVAVFSFHAIKSITTGEGGLVATNCKTLFDKMKLFRNHGITRNQKNMTHRVDGPWYYQQINLGFNYRMTDLQAALGMSQLKKLNRFVEKRNNIAKLYSDRLQGLPLSTQSYDKRDYYSAMHLYVVRFDFDSIEKSQVQIFHEMRANGIGVNLHYIPVHTQPYYQRTGFKWGDFPEAELYYSETMSLPIFPSLKKDEVEFICDAIHQIVK